MKRPGTARLLRFRREPPSAIPEYLDTAKAERRRDNAIAQVISFAAFLLYGAARAPTMLEGDAGEFQFVPHLLAVPHPTGYPLYSLLGWAWTHLVRLRDVAGRMNQLSAVLSALAVALLFPVARSLLRQAVPRLPLPAARLIALVASCTFAVTPTFWSQSVRAEVYPLHILLTVLLLRLVLAWGERAESPGTGHPARTLLTAAFVAGLCLAHHRTALLLFPALAAYLFVVARSGDRAGTKGSAAPNQAGAPNLLSFRAKRGISPLLARTLLAAAALLLPLALYLYIPWRAPHTPFFRLALAPGRELVLYENSLRGFADYALGGRFAGSLDFSVDLGQRLAMAGRFFLDNLGWAGAALALAGLLRLAIGRRWALLALTGLAFLAVVAFGLVYTIGDVVVMLIPAFLVAVLWIAVCLGALAEGLARLRLPNPARLLALVPAFALPIWLAAGHYTQIDQSDSYDVRYRWEEIMAGPLPSGAILVSNDRDEMMPMWYLQYGADGKPVRPDLLGLFPLISLDYPDLGTVLDLALGTGRPTYLIKEMPGVEVKVAVQPEGGLWRVLGPGAPAAPAVESGATWAGAVRLAGYGLAPEGPRPGEALEISLHWQPLRPLEAPYHTFVHLLDAAGERVAQSDRQPGGVYYPATLWKPGERLLDVHRLDLPAGLSPGSYRLFAGLYRLEGDGSIVPLDAPVQVGTLDLR